MTAADFRRIALSLEGADEGSHMGVADFRIAGRIFATLAHESRGYGNLMLAPDQQSAFVADAPEAFLPVAGGWGRQGATHVKLDHVSEEMLSGALKVAWKRRLELNQKTKKPKAPPRKRVDF